MFTPFHVLSALTPSALQMTSCLDHPVLLPLFPTLCVVLAAAGPRSFLTPMALHHERIDGRERP